MSETYEFCRTGYSRRDCNVAVGQTLRNTRRGLLIVTRADEAIDSDEGQKPWAQRYWARACTDEERLAAEHAARVTALESELRTLSGQPDDERDRERIEVRCEAIRAELATI